MSYNVKSVKTKPSDPFRTFEDLETYQAAREFRKKMYGVGRRVPDFEKYALADQVRRAALSLTNNIAEGHGRYHFADQVKFFLGSRGSLQELIDDLNTCDDEHYLEPREVAELKAEGWRLLGLINGYLRYLRDRKIDSQSKVREGDRNACREDMELLALIDEALVSPPF
jgi:four helix bundle protein